MADPSLLTHIRGYVGFDENAASRLQSLGPSLRPHFTTIVGQFYDAILSDPVAKSVLRDEAQVERLRASMFDWLEDLVTGPYDEAYFLKRARIGRVHVRVGLGQRYMLGAMNLIRIGLHRGLAESYGSRPVPFDEHRAIEQICDIELAIMLETYREDYVSKKTAEAESLAVMGRLTAGLAHEIRNPLNAAMLQLDVLQRNAETVQEPSIRRRIERRTSIVQDELQRLSILLDDFLNLARARRLYPVECDGCELLLEVIDLRRPELESQGIELVADLDAGSCKLLAEGDRLKQVVNNLITNAVEALVDRESPSIRVVSRSRSGGRWEVSVIDNGIGLAPEVAERAFESFVTTKEAGTGLGLAIVKRIVELHGGTVELGPEALGGTRATFWIPVAS